MNEDLQQLKESVEIKFTGELVFGAPDAPDEADFIELAELDIMSGQGAMILEIKSACTLVIATSEWAQVYIGQPK